MKPERKEVILAMFIMLGIMALSLVFFPCIRWMLK